ncbi:hypothetical protein FN846DRAFT_911883 [Sphaerosporella brunnea]|uniref:Uncharacterized protein n=1 Tax=Sphaerosporella brunnea TaxID=1250544 RepID=A0A5J5EJK4_9PEZI|nr:hypothetical protein FN846DRAFT_911883 [Sphaerosporella brunnea]
MPLPCLQARYTDSDQRARERLNTTSSESCDEDVTTPQVEQQSQPRKRSFQEAEDDAELGGGATANAVKTHHAREIRRMGAEAVLLALKSLEPPNEGRRLRRRQRMRNGETKRRKTCGAGSGAEVALLSLIPTLRIPLRQTKKGGTGRREDDKYWFCTNKPAQTRDLFKPCVRWKKEQAVLWKAVAAATKDKKNGEKERTERRKANTPVKTLLSDERCDGFPSSTQVGMWPG